MGLGLGPRGRGGLSNWVVLEIKELLHMISVVDRAGLGTGTDFPQFICEISARFMRLALDNIR